MVKLLNKRHVRFRRAGRMLTASALSVMLAFTATGCGRKTVDYNVDGEGSSSDATLASKYGIPAQCDEELDTGDSGLSRIAISDKEITYPESSGMDIAYYTENEETKKDLVEKIFDEDEVIYQIDLYGSIKSDIQNSIDNYEKIVQIYTENGMPATAADYQSEIEMMQEDYENARDEYPVASDYSDDAFRGTIDGREYQMIFMGDTISLSYFDSDYRERDDLTNVASYDYGSSLSFDEDLLAGLNNLCEYSVSEAQNLAEDFMGDIGIDDMLLTETSDLCWAYTNLLTNEYDLIELDGYVFTFVRAIGNTPVATWYLDMADNLNFEDGYISMGAEACTIWVDSNGIVSASWGNYMEKTGESEEDVELLSFDKLLEAANENIAAYYTEYPTNYSEIVFDDMELTYFLSETDEEGVFKYTPAWILTENEKYSEEDTDSYISQIVVLDATDGSVIDLVSLAKDLGAYYSY